MYANTEGQYVVSVSIYTCSYQFNCTVSESWLVDVCWMNQHIGSFSLLTPVFGIGVVIILLFVVYWHHIPNTDMSYSWPFIRISNSSSSFVNGTVEWLYKPCAINCIANGFFWPDDFLILARLFWNQILIWASFSPNSALSCCLRRSVK